MQLPFCVPFVISPIGTNPPTRISDDDNGDDDNGDDDNGSSQATIAQPYLGLGPFGAFILDNKDHINDFKSNRYNEPSF